MKNPRNELTTNRGVLLFLATTLIHAEILQAQQPASGSNAAGVVQSAPTNLPTQSGGIPSNGVPTATIPNTNSSDGGVQTLKDPFANSPAILRAAGANPDGSQIFYPGVVAPTAPVMRLRGQVRDNKGNAIALLELDKDGTYTVREGDTISLQGKGQFSAVKIKAITRQSLMVEFGSMGQVMIIR